MQYADCHVNGFIEMQTEIRGVNPLVGSSTADTIENVAIYLNSMADAFAARHNDPGIAIAVDVATRALVNHDVRR